MARNAFATLVTILLTARAAWSAPLTASDAVKIALQHSTQILQSESSVLSARSGLWSAYSGVLPHVSAGGTRSGSFTGQSNGTRLFGTTVVPSTSYDAESYSGGWDLSGTWGVVNLSSITGLSSARAEMKSAQYGRQATRQAVALATRRQFYEVVKAAHLAVVSAQSLRVARDNERRVDAMYEVGSVAKSDLLQARVNTSSSIVDSLVADHNVTLQRILLAEQLGVAEAAMGEVDTTLTAEYVPQDPATVLADARASRPDIKAAESDVRSSELGLRSANWARFPYVSANGSYSPSQLSQSKLYETAAKDAPFYSSSLSERNWSGSISLNLDIFAGFSTESRIASARSRLAGSRATRDALVRNLESEVQQALLAYQEAGERQALAQSSLESASENLNIVQQKYKVGSATILDLITSQVALATANSNLVTALAGIREAEAQLDEVRGRAE